MAAIYPKPEPAKIRTGSAACISTERTLSNSKAQFNIKMEKITLGRSTITVSRLCFGSLTVGPLQANLPLETGADVIAHALEKGVNFIDTAQYYENYDYIRLAMKKTGLYDTVISSKTYAYDRDGALKAVDEARNALDRDYIDIFMLHEQESYDTLRGHIEALETLFELREKGIIRAVGVSMHHIAAVDGVCRMAQLYPIDIVHPIFNKSGVGIADGSVEQMAAALKKAREMNLGIFAMKPLGGGHLIKNAEEALSFVLQSGLPHAVALGMQSVDEVDANIAFFETGRFPDFARQRLAQKHRRLHIEDYCEGCGNCVERCTQSALRIEDGHAVVDSERCVLCGYCAKVCPLFALKVL